MLRFSGKAGIVLAIGASLLGGCTSTTDSATEKALSDTAVAGTTVEQSSSSTDTASSLLESLSSLAGASGGFHAFGGNGPLGSALDLTDDQQSQAEEIFSAARTDIEALRTAAHDEIAALLTDDQAAEFDNLHGAGGPHALRTNGDSAADHASFALGGGYFGIGGCGLIGGDGAPDAAAVLDSLTTALDLTAEQQAAIQPILEDVIAAVAARREQAQTDFRAILTEEQIATLDSLTSQYTNS